MAMSAWIEFTLNVQLYNQVQAFWLCLELNDINKGNFSVSVIIDDCSKVDVILFTRDGVLIELTCSPQILSTYF